MLSLTTCTEEKRGRICKDHVKKNRESKFAKERLLILSDRTGVMRRINMFCGNFSSKIPEDGSIQMFQHFVVSLMRSIRANIPPISCSELQMIGMIAPT